MYSLLVLIRSFLRLFGLEFSGFWLFRIHDDAAMSSVAKFIEGLRFRGFWAKAFWGGVIHGGAASIALGALYAYRGDQFQHGLSEMSWLLVAHLWAYIGPPLIWYHEKYSQSDFYDRASRIIESEDRKALIKRILFSNLNAHGWISWPRRLWVLASMFAFLYYHEFYEKLGIAGVRDIWFWLIALGVFLLANYTSIGIGRVLTALWAVWEVDISEPTPRRLHHDHHLGYSFVTDFTAKTCALFSTGALFFPLIYRLSAGASPAGSALPDVMIGTVVLLIGCSLMLPVLWTRSRISKEKTSLARDNYAILVEKEREYASKRTQKAYYAYMYQRSVHSDIMSARQWLLQSDAVAKFFPTLIGLAIGYLTLKATWLMIPSI
ncbi:hypothetical protein [Oricola nitratireducens]|uniref:hypothetical protein n=1 Tax=Oricola nitratireducens TaxID=2775868 RepID=UPI001867D493|nr:hypothetical protein [Oricola nitratireducens]